MSTGVYREGGGEGVKSSVGRGSDVISWPHGSKVNALLCVSCLARGHVSMQILFYLPCKISKRLQSVHEEKSGSHNQNDDKLNLDESNKPYPFKTKPLWFG